MNRVFEYLNSIGIAPNKYLFEKDCLYPLLELNDENEFSAQAKQKLRMNSLAIRERYRFLKDVFTAFDDINYAVIKGAVLSQSAYGGEGYRKSGDVDLLVSPKDIGKVKYRLKSLGFVQGYMASDVIRPLTRAEVIFYSTTTHQLAPFCRQVTGIFNNAIEIDVNFDIMWGESNVTLGIDDFRDGIMWNTIFDLKIKTLRDVYEFIAVCLHHYKDLNSVYLLYSRGFQVKHLCDIYYFLVKHPDITPKKLLYMAQKFNVVAYIYNCITYAFLFFGDNYLEPYIKALSTNYAVQLFQYFGLCDDERQRWGIPFEKRIVSEELHEYLLKTLSSENLKKIETNTLMMHLF